MKKIFYIPLLGLFFLGNAATLFAAGLDKKVEHALQFSQEQLKRTVSQIKDPSLLVRATNPDGSWGTIKASDWTSGFFPGLLWMASEYTKEPEFQKWAEGWTALLEDQKNNTRDHDVGFRIFCSYGNGYRLHGSKDYQQVILTTAKSLATRFNPKVGCTRSWSWSNGKWTFPVIIDNMMNLELLFWASKNGGDPAWYDMAVKHAETTMKNHLRPDGGSFHVVDYHPETGAVNERVTHQGYKDDSTWARGQAWGIYGFTVAYRETGDQRFLETAKKLARYFIRRLPKDYVPYWDFQAPGIPNAPRDSSAAAIAASGLLELSALTPAKAEKKEFRKAAENILGSLCSQAYLAEGTKLSSLLQHATGHKPKESEVDIGIIYGDYYFMEALLRYKNPGRIPKPTPAPPGR